MIIKVLIIRKEFCFQINKYVITLGLFVVFYSFNDIADVTIITGQITVRPTNPVPGTEVPKHFVLNLTTAQTHCVLIVRSA